MRKNIANGFTLLNLFLGCIGIIISLYYSSNAQIKTSDEASSLVSLSTLLTYAGIFIIFAAVVDFLDGFVARLLGISSEMGKQLDSLADVVSFGVAPGLIVFRYLNFIFLTQGHTQVTSILYAIPALLIPVAAAYRLGRFNISTSKSVNFEGVPVPAAGLLTVALPFIFLNQNPAWIQSLPSAPWFWYVYIFIVCWLMVSTLPLLSLKAKGFSFQTDWWKLVIVFVAVISAITMKWLAVPITFVLYVVLSIIFLRKKEEQGAVA